MRVVSANVNGVRAAVRRGGLVWLAEQGPDVLCLQEVRADRAQLEAALQGSPFAGWHLVHAACATPGRAGVAVLSRHPRLRARTDLDDADFHGCGRWVEVELAVPAADGSATAVTVASCYVHTGQAGTPRQTEKSPTGRRT